MELKEVAEADQAKVLNGVYGTTEDAINQNQNFRKLHYVVTSPYLKPFIDLGFLRIFGYGKGIDKAGNLRIANMQLISSNTSVYNHVNVLFGDKDGDTKIINIPYLHSDAIGILASIVDKTLQKAAGTEQTRDAYKWYKDNSESMLFLRSALQVNSTSLSCTGFGFSLEASNTKIAQAMNEAVKAVEDSFKEMAEKGKGIMADIFCFEDNSSNRNVANILVRPPAEAK
jgi:hypothetical protein